MTKTIHAPARSAFALALFVASLIGLVLTLPFSAEAAEITQQLDPGETSPDVTTLQTFLASDSSIYPEGIVSGFYGDLTTAAVTRFQVANGLAAVGRVGPLTRDAINAKLGGTTSGGPVTYGDQAAPVLYPETVTVTPNSATIKWSTSEAGNNRVMYGNSWPFLYATASSVVSSGGYSSTANVTINGLQSRATYYYVVESIDGSGNQALTVGKPFTTQ